MFSGVVNPCTGKLEWVQRDCDVTSESADISHELARSQYGDMLLDEERNHLYQKGIELAVAKVKASKREPHVLDIGTGTGLLAMMAAKAGATRVTACEVLRPMTRIARQVISQNGFSDVIQIVAKRSTEMTEADMSCRANILVTEVFDTELIGEGALETFAHAHKHLLEPDSIVVPSSSRVYARLVESDFLWQHHKIVPDRLPEGIKLPASWAECSGPPSLWDLHVEEVKTPGQMKPISKSVEVAKFEFDDSNLSPESVHPPVDFHITEDGLCHGLVMWWDIRLGDSTLTMDPWRYLHWRDHWLQAIQLWPQPAHLKKDEMVKVGLKHDNYSVWFSLERASVNSMVSSIERPLCTCGLHTACSRSRINMYNDTNRNRLYMQVLSQVLMGKTTVVCVGDGCLWPLFLLLKSVGGGEARLPQHFYILSNSSHSTNVIKQLIDASDLSTSVTCLVKSHGEICAKDFKDNLIDAVIGEPYFSSSLLPWHNLHFWYAVNSLQSFMTRDCHSGGIFPAKGFLMAIAVRFDNLYKLRASVGNVEGFNITAFDQAVGKHTTTPEGIEAEPHSLWEYPSYARSKVHNLMTFDFASVILSKAELKESGEMLLDGEDCHGVVLWMDYALTETVTTSTGLKHEPRAKSEKLEWDTSFKQAVYFLSPKDTNQSLVKLKYHVQFSSASGNIETTIFGVH